jgi:SAM-dependent methyltransferase
MVHEAAAKGFQEHADAYQRGRPSYHPELVRRIVERCGGGDLVELGSGTGIFTAQMLDAGVSMIAIEPVQAMREVLRANVGVEVLEGTAEAIPLGDTSVDCVLAAQSFHWFDARAALDEISRVLRPFGHLVTAWNVRDGNVPWVARFNDVLDQYAGDTPRQETAEWRKAIDEDSRFLLVDDWATDNPIRTDIAGVVDRALSTSFIASLDAASQSEVTDKITGIVFGMGPQFLFPYRSQLQVWQLR